MGKQSGGKRPHVHLKMMLGWRHNPDRRRPAAAGDGGGSGGGGGSGAHRPRELQPMGGGDSTEVLGRGSEIGGGGAPVRRRTVRRGGDGDL